MANQRALAVIVLAAGEGKRFKSSSPKVLHDLCGRPMLGHVLDAVAPLKPARAVIVVGRGAEQVEAASRALTALPVRFALQAQQLGTADAARVGDEALEDLVGDVLVLPGDAPLIGAATLKRLAAYHRKQKAAATILSATLDDPAGYGRIIRDGDGAVDRIVEHADASAAERETREVNSSTYVFDRAALRAALETVEPTNAQGEYYLTDVIAALKHKGEKVVALSAAEPDEVRGANDRAQLADLAALMRARINKALMQQGVTIVDPAQTYIDPSVRIGRDSVIHPLTFLRGATVVGSGCSIGPAADVTDSRIDDGATVTFATLKEARVGPEATVGPFAYLRPGAVLKRRAKVGTYVEVKGSTIGEGSKVPHLSYVGDATIGKDVNVGAATVTVNYDGETGTKSKTVIGDGVKIGSDTMLVAPVKIGKGAITGAGSVVTRDVPPDTVVAGVPARPMRKRKGATKGDRQR